MCCVCARGSAVPQPAQARCRHSPSLSLSVLIAAALDHLVGSSAVRVRAGDARRCVCPWLGRSAAGAGSMQTHRPLPSLSVLTAAAIAHMVGSAAVRVRAGDTRPARIEARATASHLAAPFAFFEQLLQHRMTHTHGTAAQPLRFSGRTDWRVLCVPVGRPFRGRAGSMHTQAIAVDVGAHSGGD